MVEGEILDVQLVLGQKGRDLCQDSWPVFELKSEWIKRHLFARTYGNQPCPQALSLSQGLDNGIVFDILQILSEPHQTIHQGVNTRNNLRTVMNKDVPPECRITHGNPGRIPEPAPRELQLLSRQRSRKDLNQNGGRQVGQMAEPGRQSVM